MTGRRLVRLVIAAAIAGLVIYIARHTYWTEITVPQPPQGEARTNPFYAVQRFAEALGARTEWNRAFVPPPADAIVVISSWHWSLSSRRQELLEDWVEAGGRLVVDALLLVRDEAFTEWSGVGWRYRRRSPEEEDEVDQAEDSAGQGCRTLSESFGGPEPRPGATYWVCNPYPWWLTTDRPAEWQLQDDSGLHAVRVRVGQGTVTVLNSTPFRERELFSGDHGALFVAATALRRGDAVHFLSEDDHPSLIELAWQHGSSAILLALCLVALTVWRGASRFGPIEPPPVAARRSLAEQIRGSGRFVLRYGDGDALHAASVRALQDTAARYVPRYTRLKREQQAEALARATGFDRDALAAAMYHAARRRPQEIRDTIALLEAARREILLRDGTGRSHGTN